MKLASVASEAGGVMPAVMNASNEIAVHGFLKGQIPFTKIYPIIKSTMDTYSQIHVKSLEDIVNADLSARLVATKLLNT